MMNIVILTFCSSNVMSYKILKILWLAACSRLCVREEVRRYVIQCHVTMRIVHVYPMKLIDNIRDVISAISEFSVHYRVDILRAMIVEMHAVGMQKVPVLICSVPTSREPPYDVITPS